LRSPVALVDMRDVTVSDTYATAAPAAPARPEVQPPDVAMPAAEVESPEDIVARLERWVAAAASNRLGDHAPAPPATVAARPSPPPAACKVRDDLLPSDPGWSAILNEDVTPVGLATVACLFTLLSFVAFGLRNASIASGAVLLGALIVGVRDRSRSALATRIICGVAIGMAIACLS
jgi:hypothetical protein